MLMKLYDPLKKAIQNFHSRPDYREKCFTSLQVEKAQIPKIIDGIDLLILDLGLPNIQRTFQEQHGIPSKFRGIGCLECQLR